MYFSYSIIWKLQFINLKQEKQRKENIKVRHTATEKPFLAGEILVARVTDPGWTTLFVYAGAIILKVGGPLQHGAVVAREYGKPCVGGIQGATESFQDGELVSVDGNGGLVRKIMGSANSK